MQQSLNPLGHRVSGNLPVHATHELELVPSLAQTTPEAVIEGRLHGLFLDTFRANLHAAARHASLGHVATSFRECHGPACIEATNLIPELDPAQGAATDAELEAILDQVLTSLEREGTTFFAMQPS